MSLQLVRNLVAAGYKTTDDTFTTYSAAKLLADFINACTYVERPFSTVKKLIGGGVARILVQPAPNAAPPAAEVVPAIPDTSGLKYLYLLEFKNGFRYAAGGIADRLVGGVRLKAIPIDTAGMSQAEADLVNEVNQPTTETQAEEVAAQMLYDLYEKSTSYEAAQGVLAEQNKPAPNPFHPTE